MNGKDILQTLIDLLATQEEIKITYKIEEVKNETISSPE